MRCHHRGFPYTVFGPEQGSTIVLTDSLANALTLDIGYRGEISTDDALDSHGASLGLNWNL